MSTPQKDYGVIKKEILDILSQPDYDDGSAGPVLVRYVLLCTENDRRSLTLSLLAQVGVARIGHV